MIGDIVYTWPGQGWGARAGSYISTNCIQQQQPRLQLMFPDNYIPPIAINSDQPIDSLLFQLNPQGNNSQAKCTVRLSKLATSLAGNIQYTMRFQFWGCVQNLFNIQLIFSMNIEGNFYFWNAFQYEWTFGQEGVLRAIKKGRFYNEGGRQLSVAIQVGDVAQEVDMGYEA
ncbi:hypothetical protein SBOR_9257 [Sclerotinia borealis F-4128]|uniref:Uncharacterized protein n=1 Tax=Sclerotinia borealis (strain F-4128) TaxID=1432307 RepID=W9C3C1_SCLBF|nr:hypothetical protein SBOR_9257 [Sclerotinia borealis F-4128]